MFEPPSVPDVQRAVGDKYQVDRLSGHGGMGAVYFGRNTVLGSPVAIKVLPLGGDETESGLARFKREARLAANLSHPNIVSVFDFDIRSGLAYLVMPFVEGETLAQALEREGRFDFARVRTLLEQVGKAVAFAHEQGVVHRDIKPSNLMREEATGRWLVTDFGIARLSRPDADDRTETGMAIGTPAYMAPEQWAGARDVDGRADLYSLARVACEALTGRQRDLPMSQREVGAVVLGASPDLEPELVEALVAPLADDREARPPSVDAWLAMLGAGRRPRRVLRMALLAALALVGVLLVVRAVSVGPTATAPLRRLVVVAPFESDTGRIARELAGDVRREFADQLSYIPAVIVVGPGGLQSFATAAGDGATERFDTTRVTGRVQLVPRDSLAIHLTVRREGRDDAAQYAHAGPVDSAAVLVWHLVQQAFSPGPSLDLPSLPRGRETLRAWREGSRQFRRGAYDAAVEQFDEVIRHQPTFAPAYFKRMLAEVMRLEPTRAGDAVRSALEAARLYREGLDPASRELLVGYELLLTNGDLSGALEKFEEVHRARPDAVDAYFIKGFLQLQFAPLLSRPRRNAKRDLLRAYALDSTFAAVVANLARLTILEGNDVEGRRFLREYLALDSTSVSAQVARTVDSLLYRGDRAKTTVLLTLDERELGALEYLALAAGELRQRKAHREFALRAVQAIGRRAVTPHERLVALRMALSTALGMGKMATVDTLLAAARFDRHLAQERSRWQLLAAATGVARLADTADRGIAARLLSATPADSTGTDAWLVARWARGRDAPLAASARQALVVLPSTPLTLSLLDDLEALDRLARGDTAAALDAWRAALSRYSVEHVVFGLVASLWPLRLEAARVAAAAGDQAYVLRAAEAFEEMAGFTDQVAWREILPLRVAALRVAGHHAPADTLRDLLINLLSEANGLGLAQRDSLRAALPSSRR